MIKSWANSATRQFAEVGKSRFSGMDEIRAQRALRVLNAADSLHDISPLRSVGLHRLARDRKGQWSMTINAAWRLCFRFSKGDAFDVEIVDHH